MYFFLSLKKKWGVTLIQPSFPKQFQQSVFQAQHTFALKSYLPLWWMLVIIDADVVTRKSSVAIGICKKSYKITIFVLKHQQNFKINEPVSKKCIYESFLFAAMRQNCIQIKTDKKCSYKHFTLKALKSPLKTNKIFSSNKIVKTCNEHVIKSSNCQNCGDVL